MHTMLSSVLAGLTNAYIGMVRLTSRITIVGEVQEGDFLGYWHGESMLMMLLLGELPDMASRASVVVTADGRGDVIEKVLRKHRARSIRVHDGLAARHALKNIKDECTDERRIIATALDGPTGPYKQPKALLIRLAERQGRGLMMAGFICKRAIRMNNRWDKYMVPLPFSCITAVLMPYTKGEAEKEQQSSPAIRHEQAAM